MQRRVAGRRAGTGGGLSEGEGAASLGWAGGGTREQTPLALRAERGVGAMDRRTAEGGLISCPGRGPGGGPAGRRRRGAGASVAHRAPPDVHARQTEHEGGHELESCGSRRGLRREERSTPRWLGGAPAVGEEPEVADLPVRCTQTGPDEAYREDVQEEAAKDLLGRVIVFRQFPRVKSFHLPAVSPVER